MRMPSTSKLWTRPIEERLKQKRCEICGRDSWNGKPIPLELDHANGIGDGNRFCN
jgi:hypothetical protein